VRNQSQKESPMKNPWASWLAVIGAAMATACTSNPIAQPETQAPTLVVRTSSSTMWTTAETEAAAAASAAAAAAAAATARSASVAATTSKDAVARQAAATRGAASASALAPVDAEKGAKAGGDATPAGQKSPVEKAEPPRTVYFEFDSYEIRPEFGAVLEVQSKRLAADQKLKIVVEGHADDRGGAEYNLALGQRRAEVVAKALKLLGAREDQIEAVSFGDTRPLSQEKTEAAWAKNRRAEIKP
jgi:peptidoglycan-associated lipoprotein